MTRSTLRQFALGAFVLGQLGFLAAANFLWLVRRNETSATKQLLAWPTDRYADLTGQAQGWSQYSPTVPHQTVFPMVEWRDDDRPPGAPGGITYISECEPADVTNYVHAPGNRLACYEGTLMLPLWPWGDEARADPTAWMSHLREKVGQRRTMIEAYLRWRTAKLGRPVGTQQIILLGRIWRVSPPGEEPRTWRGPELVPLARCRRVEGVDRFAVDVYDPFERRFIEIPSDEHP